MLSTQPLSVPRRLRGPDAGSSYVLEVHQAVKLSIDLFELPLPIILITNEPQDGYSSHDLACSKRLRISNDDRVAGDSVSASDHYGNLWLGGLTGHEGLLRGEGHISQRNTGQDIDAVRGVLEILEKEGLS